MGLFNKKEVTKNFRYYFAEIIVVVIGIFIAIQLNNLNENRKSKKEEQKSLKRIYSDLETEKKLLQASVNEIKKSSSFLKEVVFENKRDNLDSLYIHASQTFFHYKFNSEYINLKYSGKLNLITNERLRFLLVRYYEAGYTFYQETSKLHRKFTEEKINTYFKDEFPRDTTNLLQSKLVFDKLKSQKLTNILIDQLNEYNYLLGGIRVNETEFLLETIKNEIKEN
ncbi:hypothetical protein [Flavobacterium okayamense]|uniref:Phage abortive infection protein n=1 Tax=Flavobacterium okayamense TaxID=2830782 RepID=A0ABM7S797_9FLAO|nr:hypothetical protein [Flavobacterium okayamense]BCY28601.1 hypothetical protein KK2020170_14690 [Flavobacterium okayamense]